MARFLDRRLCLIVNATGEILLAPGECHETRKAIGSHIGSLDRGCSCAGADGPSDGSDTANLSDGTPCDAGESDAARFRSVQRPDYDA